MITKVDIANKIGPFMTWWLYLWGFVAIGLIAIIFFVPFWIWAIAAIVGFGTMEGFGLATKGPYPPLTYVIRAFVPYWFSIPVIWMFTAAAGATWMRIHHVLSIAAIAALLGWFNTHFLKSYKDIDKF